MKERRTEEIYMYKRLFLSRELWCTEYMVRERNESRENITGEEMRTDKTGERH